MSSPSRLRASCRGLFTAVAMLSFGVAVAAKPVPASERLDRTEPLPERLRGIDVREHLNESLPAELGFTDEAGKAVKLGDYFDGRLPVILTLNYSRCPMLCSLELNALVSALKDVDWTLGKDFRIVTVVLDPGEKPADAQKSKARYLRAYGRAGAEQGWHFLTGTEADIRHVANAVGFSYAYNEKRDEYVHPAAIMLLTPKGKLARYLYGVEYQPKTVRLSLVEASEGKIGTTVDQFILYCFHYDESEGRYAPVAMNIMRVGGCLTATVLGGFLGTYWLSESRKRRKSNPASGGESARSAQT